MRLVMNTADIMIFQSLAQSTDFPESLSRLQQGGCVGRAHGVVTRAGGSRGFTHDICSRHIFHESLDIIILNPGQKLRRGIHGGSSCT